MLDVLDDFLWTLRREGLTISPAQALNVMLVAREVGFADPVLLRDAVASVVVDRRALAAIYAQQFARYFGNEREPPTDLAGRLRALGFTERELDALRDLLEQMEAVNAGGHLRALLAGDASLDHLLTTQAATRWLDQSASSAQVGFYAHRLFEEVGLPRARAALAVLRAALIEALGRDRGDALSLALAAELAGSERRVRQAVEARALRAEEAARAPGDARSTAFAALTAEQADDVRRAVRALAEKLAGAARVRRRHARRGHIDGARTQRASFRTGGVPFRPIRIDRRRDKPRLVLLCDVSDSVRAASRFMLEFVYAMQELFESTRCFVFVNDVHEVTTLFQRAPIGIALAGASSITASGNSSYGRALTQFDRRHPSALDRRTTLLVMGDGRTNFLPNGVPALRRLRARVKDILWLCPEPRGSWGQGDSSMRIYAAEVNEVLEAGTADGLERAARALVRRTRSR
jgi:uncharacterized protein with von Willebrand factor type A (vWA) domain